MSSELSNQEKNRIAGGFLCFLCVLYRLCGVFFLFCFLKEVEHPVDEHAGYGDVEPKRQRPSGDSCVTCEFSSQSVIESCQG